MLLNEDDYFTLFSRLKAEPRWVTSAGKQSIQLIGRCHHGDNHSALFDPSTLKVNCFSECGRGMLLHTWVKQALNFSDPQEAKDFIEDWIDNRNIDFSDRIPIGDVDFNYTERPYDPTQLPETVPGMPTSAWEELLQQFSQERFEKLVWHTEDGIDVDVLKRFDVYYYPQNQTIILPHHNINGEVVGIYERSFKPLRKKVKEEFPDIPYKQLLTFPRAKYVPMLRSQEWRDENKTSWSFPNSQNLYGLHLAKDAIKRTNKAIVFEGGKSVMLAHQYGYPYAVATHTFGIHLNHISLLIAAGATEIYLAFDKQYEEMIGQAWELYEKKTKEIARKVGAHAKIYRLIDNDNLIGFKDSPIDCGKTVFETLLNKAELLSDAPQEKKPVNNKPKNELILPSRRLSPEEQERIAREEEAFYAKLRGV